MLDPKEKHVLTDLKTATESLSLPLLVIGAGARLLIFDRPLNLNGRATKDWDVAIQVNSWSVYQKLCDRLTQSPKPLFRRTATSHKFIHTQTEVEIDIVPFGAIGKPNQKIEWPNGNQMNVRGLEEALAHASYQTFDGIELQILNTPAFIALKLFAWSDRRANKDLEDVNFILQNYSDDDRVFSELSAELSDEQVEFEHAAILLLGRDIGNTFYSDTLFDLDNILTDILQHQDR